MIRFIILITAVLVSSNEIKAQGCEDTLRGQDPYHIIQTDYAPVCGCDGVTYRNSDAAYWWGGLFTGAWTDNFICDNFDIDLYPNVITNESTGLGHLRIYMKYAGNATLSIYNAFGNLMFEKLFSTSVPNAIMPSANPYDLFEAQSFPRGIYNVIVTVGGERKVRKFLRVTE